MTDDLRAQSRSLTIVVHLPQRVDKVSALLRLVSEEWPRAAFTGGLDRLEIPADE